MVNRDVLLEYIKAITNPQTAEEWQLALSDPRSLLQKDFVAMVNNAVALEDGLLLAEIYIELKESIKEKIRFEEFLQSYIDQISASQLVNQQAPSFISPVPQKEEVRISKINELKAEVVQTQNYLDYLHEQKPRYQKIIKDAPKILKKIEVEWDKRQVKQAVIFADNINANLSENGAGFALPDIPEVKERLKKAFTTAAPTKIISVNPGLAKNLMDAIEPKPATPAEILKDPAKAHLGEEIRREKNIKTVADAMVHAGDFHRKLKALSEILRLKHENETEGEKTEIFPKPSELLRLEKGVKIPLHDKADGKAVRDVLRTKAEVINAENKLKEIPAVQKKIIRLTDEIKTIEFKVSPADMMKNSGQ